ncbi:MAG: asparagine synthase (glutamine-hydrolyzing) [Defluviitaleaceae bacterium]|nr:asparagine synthase (glutamine-hydrolyzing) [Defluviitaleaceae bacterium]
MTERIKHRGPDGEGYYITPAISLGFRRLSFFDLENGDQPMQSADGRFCVVFNGEIYNFREIRARLAELGRQFRTDSDTEVLLHLYDQYGAEMTSHLRGMFAFVIYDKTNDEIFAARDFFGIKPFYYGVFGGSLLFASEIKAFLEHPSFEKNINHSALESYLSFQYSVQDETFFKGVFKLPAAHSMRYKNGEITIARYWQAQFSPEDTPLQELVEKIDKTVKTSVEYHRLADVEVGSLLSGGLDSSYVTAVSDVAKTFTVGFDYEGFSEIERAKELSKEKGAQHISKIITAEEYWEILPKIQYHMDEPLADPAAVALYFVCKLASENVKGVLSGEGADELFGGYGIYREPLDLAPITRLPMPLRRLIGAVAQKFPFKIKGRNYLIRASKTIEQRFIGNANIFSDMERAEILKHTSGLTTAEITKPYFDKVAHCDDITKMQYLDIHLWLTGDILLKADKMSMANSLEARVPFLDKEVFAVAAKIPTRYRMNKRAGKYALRLAASRNFIDQKEKKRLGFPVPTRLWLREEKYYNIVLSAFKQDFVAEFFHTDKLITLLERHRAKKEDNSRKIWAVYMFCLWYKEMAV